MVSLCSPPPLPPEAKGPRVLTTTPTFDHLYKLLPETGDRPTAAVVPAEEVPAPYHGLLVHTHHMTVPVERFYGSRVDVRVLACRRNGEESAGKTLLPRGGGGAPAEPAPPARQEP